MRSPAPTAESVSQHRHRSQSPPKKKDKKQKKDKKRSRSEDPRGSGSQVLSGTPPLRTQSEERAIDEELAEQYELEQPIIEQSSPKQPKDTFAIKIEDISQSEDEHMQVESPVRQQSIVVEDETFKPKKIQEGKEREKRQEKEKEERQRQWRK